MWVRPHSGLGSVSVAAYRMTPMAQTSTASVYTGALSDCSSSEVWVPCMDDTSSEGLTRAGSGASGCTYLAPHSPQCQHTALHGCRVCL